MRSSILASILVLVGCHKAMTGDDMMNGPDASTPVGDAAFTITSSDFTLQPNQEITICYYFHTPNTTPIPVNKWVSDMTAGSHHMIFFTGGPAHADGIDMNNSCGLGTSTSNPAAWVYASQTPHQEEDLPADDGGGKPLAQLIQPNTQGAFQMHYLNPNDTPLTVHVSLSAYALASGTTYSQTDAFITYNQDISIGPGATNFPVTATCNLPAGAAGAKFWTMSTHAHKQAITTDVLDGTSNLFHSTDWEHPGAQVWGATPFYTFASGKVTWTCTYNNTGDNAGHTITAGTSAQTNEMCMATGYFFPATGPKFCLHISGQCLCQ